MILKPPPFEPAFLFDSRERWFPCGVEESLEYAGVTVPTEKDPRKRLDFPDGMLPPPPGSAASKPVGYIRSVEAGGLEWCQFWLWYLYNPKKYVGYGVHEGDWEVVQVGCTPDDRKPILFTASQHGSGIKREWWKMHRLRDTVPVINVARHSHAHYFSFVDNPTDTADGMYPALEIEWRPFGNWAKWRGIWGNSTGQGKSPQSPVLQKRRWDTPHLFHGDAQDVR